MNAPASFDSRPAPSRLTPGRLAPSRLAPDRLISTLVWPALIAITASCGSSGPCVSAQEWSTRCSPAALDIDACEIQAEGNCSPLEIDRWGWFWDCQTTCEADQADPRAPISISDSQNGVSEKPCRKRLGKVSESCARAFGIAWYSGEP